MIDVVVTGAARTPMGGFQGDFSSLQAPMLGGAAIAAALRAAGSPAVDELLMGCVLPAGQGQAPARQAGFAAGLAEDVPATTLNKMCGSGMKAAMMAWDRLATGQAGTIVAGGMESMTNAPYLLPKMRGGARIGHGQVIDHMFLDGLEDAYDKGRLMGTFAEDCAEAFQFTRDAQDAYALASLDRALKAGADGSFAPEIVPVTVPVVPSVHRAKEFLGLRLDSAGVAGVAWWQWGADSTHDVVTRLSPRFREMFPPARASPLFKKPLLGFAGAEVILVDTRTISVTWWSRNGRLIREASFAAPPQLPSESRVARVVRGIEAMRRRAGAAAISPNRLRAAVASTAIPAVSELSPARVDAEGRVWLLGIDGDSASAFVVGERRLLRRIPISCPGFEGRWSLAGRWLAVACSADDDTIGSDAILKVFEIH